MEDNPGASDKKTAPDGAPGDGPDTLRHIGGSQSDSWNKYVAGRIFRAIWPNQSDDNGLRERQRDVIIAGMTEIGPRDTLESMIASQLLACHDAAMNCYQLALNSELHGHRRQDHLNQAGKLSRTFAILLDALNRHRGKVQQKITVEHVPAHSDGQAIVGMVETPGEGGQPKSESRSYETGIARRRVNSRGRLFWLRVTLAVPRRDRVKPLAGSHQAIAPCESKAQELTAAATKESEPPLLFGP
jgi:hypothetical protein